MRGFAKTGWTAAAVLAMAAFTAASSPPPVRAADKAGGSQCFNTGNINGFNAPDDHTLYIRVGVRDVYRLDLAAGCDQLSFRQAIALRSVPPGDPFICSAIQAEVTYRETGIPQTCQVNAMHKLSPDELKALPKRDRP